MPHRPTRRQFIHRTAAVFPAFCLILCLLPGFAAAQDLPTLEARIQWLFEKLTEVNHTYRTDGSLQSPQVFADLYLSDGQDEAAKEHIVTVMEAIAAATDPIPTRGGDIGGQVRTAAPALVRALYKFGDSFSADQLMRIRTAITGPVFTRKMREHGTENHAMDFVSAQYLLPQYFPDAIWDTGKRGYEAGGVPMTSQQMMDEARDKILRRGRGFYRVGHHEQLSTTYDVLSARSSALLWEFAWDPVVRDAGEALTLYHIGMYALNNLDGHTMPPYNRRNQIQNRFHPDKALNHANAMAWMFWGQNMLVPPGVNAAQYLRSTGFYQYRFGADPTELALAFLSPNGPQLPGLLNPIARGEGVPYEIRGANGQFGHWGSAKHLAILRYGWRDRQFAIGGPVADNFDPEQYYVDYVTFNIAWKSENRLRALEAMHPYWRSNQGEDYWRTSHSPFQQFGIHRNVAIVLYNIPDKDPWPDRGRGDWIALRDQHLDNLIKLGQVRFPVTVDELVEDGDFYFFREGDVYVAIRVLKQGHSLQQLEDAWSNELFHVVKSREAQTGFVFEVGTADEHGSFPAFRQAVKNNPLSVDWQALEVSYTSTRGDELRFRYDTDYTEDADGFIKIVPDLWINSEQRVVDFNDWPLAESPVVSLRNSVLRVEQGGDSFRVDWSGELPRINKGQGTPAHPARGTDHR